MLQEAQNDPPEPGNLFANDAVVAGEERELESDPQTDRQQQQQHQPEIHQNPPLHNHRNEETYQTYLMLATMLKYLNNGHAFSENHLED